MKLIFGLAIIYFILSGVISVNAEDKNEDEKNAKIFTQKEFDEKLEKTLKEKLARYRPSNLVELSSELLEKEKKISLNELGLKRREEQIILNERDLSRKVKDFQKDQTKVLGCIDEHDKARKRRIVHMVDTISGMKPQNAADVLSVQDADISVKILGLLPSEKVSKIFNMMGKEISARLQKQYMNMKK